MATQKPRRTLTMQRGRTPSATESQGALFAQTTPSKADLAYGEAVRLAPTTEAAWEVLAPPVAHDVEGRRLEAECLGTHAAAERGHAACRARLEADLELPQSWVDRLCVLEDNRLDAIWLLGHHRALRTPVVDVEERTPSALACRLISVATRRYGELEPPAGPWVDVAMARIDEMAPGWDSENTKTACRELIRESVRALYVRDAETAGTPSEVPAVSGQEEEESREGPLDPTTDSGSAP